MYQLAKSYDYGVNTCQQCLAKQREIDRLTEENQRLRAKLSQQKRKDQEGFFLIRERGWQIFHLAQ